MISRGIMTAFTKLVRDGQPKLEHTYPDGIKWRRVLWGVLFQKILRNKGTA